MKHHAKRSGLLKGSAFAADPQQAFWPSEGTITPLVVWNQSWQVQYQYCQSLDYVWCVFACGCVCRCDEHMSIAGARCWAGMHHFWRLHTALELTSADESGKLRIGAKWLVSKAQCADYGSELKSERVLLGKISNVHVCVCACIELRGTAIASCSSKKNRYLSLYEVDKLSWMIWAQACNAWSELERSGLRRDQGRHFLCCNSPVAKRSLWSFSFCVYACLTICACKLINRSKHFCESNQPFVWSLHGTYCTSMVDLSLTNAVLGSRSDACVLVSVSVLCWCLCLCLCENYPCGRSMSTCASDSCLVVT